MRLMGLDLGSRTCGVALSDESLTIASAYKTIRFEEDDYDKCFDDVCQIAHEQNITEIVLGLPKHMNGDIGVRGELSIQFKEELEKELNIPVALWDERLTTVAATRILIEADMSRKKRKAVVDQMAAVNILQGYLDKKKGV